MKLTILLFLFVLLSVGIHAQSVTYEIQTIRPDSFYLVERILSSVTPEQPRPKEQVGYTLFRSVENLSLFVENIRKAAQKDEDEAKSQYSKAQELKAIATKIGEVMDKSFKPKKP